MNKFSGKKKTNTDISDKDGKIVNFSNKYKKVKFLLIRLNG